MTCTCTGEWDEQKTFRVETTYEFCLLNEVFVSEPFVKCELKFFVVFTDRVEVEGIKTVIEQLACVNQKKKIEPKGYVLCVFQKFLVFSVIMTFTLNVTGLTNCQRYWKLLGVSAFFGGRGFLCCCLFCFVTATLVFRRRRERIVRGGQEWGDRFWQLTFIWSKDIFKATKQHLSHIIPGVLV